MARALVLVGGGITGIAWESGVLAGLARGGVDMQAWDLVVGTSAGAFVGARLTGDGSADPLFAIQTSGDDAAIEDAMRVLFGSNFVRALRLSRRQPFRWVGAVWFVQLVLSSVVRFAARHGIRPTIALAKSLRRGSDRDPQFIAAQIGAVANLKRKPSLGLHHFWERQLAPTRDWPSTRFVATAVDTTDGSRIAFDASSGIELIDAVAASTCLPGLLPPVDLLGRRYMDGGLSSAANADLAAGHAEIWIVSPFGAASLDRQVADLKASGSSVHVIRPGAAAEQALGPGIAVMDPTRRAAAARAGFADGLASAEEASRLVRFGRLARRAPSQ